MAQNFKADKRQGRRLSAVLPTGNDFQTDNAKQDYYYNGKPYPILNMPIYQKPCSNK
jgi:hypothetical protein